MHAITLTSNKAVGADLDQTETVCYSENEHHGVEMV